MPRPVILFSGQWTDLPLEEVAARAGEWGCHGLELCAWGDHFEVQRAQDEEGYCQRKLELLANHDLQPFVIAAHYVSQAVCDPIDGRHRPILPDYIWGDGDPQGVQERAAEEMTATIHAAEKLGVSVVSGFSGSPIWSAATGWPGLTADMVQYGLEEFADKWSSILDACAEAGVRYALEVHPGQIAFDYYSAEMVLDAVEGREELGFTVDPSHLHCLGVDPVEFIRNFGERVYHVHIKDVVLSLNGRSSLLNSYLPDGDPRRGWQHRSPGRGGVDWEGFLRALNDVGYDGPLSVECKDAGMDRDFGAEEAINFVKQLDFERPEPEAYDE